MKRGYMNWDRALLPEPALLQRRDRLFRLLREKNLDALVVYGDVINADELVDCSNYGPYWCNCVAVLTAGGDYQLVTGHNARVNPWLQEMTGLPDEKIRPAGMKVPAKTAELLKELLPGGTVGLIGKYTPATMGRALADAGFAVCYLGADSDALLARRDQAYRDTVRKGHEMMEAALEGALAESQGMDIRQSCARIEYALRSAGAMDVVLYAGTGDGRFSLPQDQQADCWNLYINVQYLGVWLCFACPVGAAEAAYAALDQQAARLNPGVVPEGCGIHTSVLSDSISSLNQPGTRLAEGQVFSLYQTGGQGAYTEKMYCMTANGAIPLGKR